MTMDSSAIRDRFFEFFGDREHRRVPSSSLVSNDPNLLLTNAGMNQFIPFFVGEQQPPQPRAMSVQKCFRTVDIDEVGKTSRHLTFFEMLGNFSFGDYYKEKACPWAWELITEGWGIDGDRLWVTIYQTDEEAREIWIDSVGVRPERIVRRGKKDNFWSMGVAGPCGPCSEVFVDLGDRFGPASELGPEGNEDRYLEIWNLVFMQNDCNASIEPVAELPKKNIDTGAGIERLALVAQKAASIYETDTLGALISTASSLTGKRYGVDEGHDKGLRILADHGRSLTFLIADGVLPSNEERGYVLRRVMRRAVRHARLLGRKDPVLAEMVQTTIDLMGKAYPELSEKKEFILQVATREEERFDETLRQGLSLLETELATAKGSSKASLAGDVAFRLHDTFGFPIDLTNEIAEDAGLSVDAERFSLLMDEQRTRARSARKTGSGAEAQDEMAARLAEDHGPTRFVGYEHLDSPGLILGFAAGGPAKLMSEGEEGWLVLDRTPFYAEGGGQVGDRGVITGSSGTADVLDTRLLVPGLRGHKIRVRAGEISVDEEVEASVDPEWRRGCERAHTATHILHWILRTRLGDHARQAGSLVEPGRLRFDFNHFEALGNSHVDEISDELQTLVLGDDHVRAYETSFDFARSIGAMAMFGEKYGDFVRVVEVGDYSKELCGGTHVPHTSQIGVVVVTSEGSVGANLRRVEALVGRDGLTFLQRRVSVLDAAARALKSTPDEVAERVERLMQSHKELERRIAEVERGSVEEDAEALLGSAESVGDSKLIVARRDLDVDGLRALAQTLKGRLDSGIVVLGAAGEGKANMVGALTKDLVERGLSARELLAPGATLLGGGGGGKPDLSISGGPAAEKLPEALELVAGAVRDALAR